MAAKQHKVWQMQLAPYYTKDDGTKIQEDIWEKCRRHNRAVMYAWDVPDLTRVPKPRFPLVWRNSSFGHNMSKQTNLKHFRYDMQQADIIYVKSKLNGIPAIVGKGIVAGDYRFDKKEFGHWRRVNWDDRFEPIVKRGNLLGKHWPVRQTLVPLKRDHVALILDAGLRARRKQTAPRDHEGSQAIPAKESETSEDLTVLEGERTMREIEIQVRDRAIIEQKKRRSHGTCEVCGFQTTSTYLDLSCDILDGHHVKQLSDAKKSRKTTLKDIAIVCPNCHQALYTEHPPMTVERLKEKLQMRF